MALALLFLTATFAALTALRIAGARRVWLLRHWFPVAFGAAGLIALLRGSVRSALVLALIGGAIWMWEQRGLDTPAARKANSPKQTAAIVEARALLGVAAGASARDIRAAYRVRISMHHPDKGGSAEMARRLTEARDLLLKAN